MQPSRVPQQTGSNRQARTQVETVFIELSNQCNFRCSFCPIHVSRRKPGRMDLALFKHIIADIRRHQITRRVGFHLLGEPLLHPQAAEAIRCAKAHGLTTELSTNGGLLNRERAHRLMDAGLDLLSVSLETTVPEEHASRGSRIPFAEYYAGVLDSVTAVVSRSPMQVTLTMMNTASRKYFQFDRFQGLVGVNQQERDFKGKLAGLIRDLGERLRVKTDPAEIKAQLDRVRVNEPKRIRIHPQINLYVQMLMDWGNAFTAKKVYPSSLGYCGYALRNIGILYDGRVTLCCGDFDGRTALGNVQKESLSRILASPQAEAVRQGFSRLQVRHPYCRHCLGGSSPLRAWLRGLLSIYLFKLKSHPLECPEVTLPGLLQPSLPAAAATAPAGQGLAVAEEAAS